MLRSSKIFYKLRKSSTTGSKLLYITPNVHQGVRILLGDRSSSRCSSSMSTDDGTVKLLEKASAVLNKRKNRFGAAKLKKKTPFMDKATKINSSISNVLRDLDKKNNKAKVSTLQQLLDNPKAKQGLNAYLAASSKHHILGILYSTFKNLMNIQHEAIINARHSATQFYLMQKSIFQPDSTSLSLKKTNNEMSISTTLLQREGDVFKASANCKNTLNLLRDYFKIFIDSPDITLNDYHTMIKAEQLNGSIGHCYKLIQAAYRKWPAEKKNINYWNWRLKVLLNGDPSLWKLKADDHRLPYLGKDIFFTNRWRGNLPFKAEPLAVIQEFMILVEGNRIIPDLNSCIYMIYGLGYHGDINLLKNQIKSIWGISLEEGESTPFIKDRSSKLYPDSKLLQSIIISFGYNGEVLSAIDYLIAFEKHYDFKLASDLWESLYKWTDYNTIIPDDNYIQKLLAEKQELKILLTSDKKMLKKLQQQVDGFADKELFKEYKQYLIDRRITLLDNVFNSYINSREHTDTISAALLERRARHLNEFSRLEQAVDEIPIFYKSCMNDQEFYTNYLLSILNMSFEAFSRYLKNNYEDSLMTEVKKIETRYLKNGAMYMINEEDSLKNRINTVPEYNLYKSRCKENITLLKNKLNKRMNNGNSADAKSYKLLNSGILNILEFYRIHDSHLKAILFERYLFLNEEYYNYRRAHNVSDFEDDDNFFGIF